MSTLQLSRPVTFDPEHHENYKKKQNNNNNNKSWPEMCFLWLEVILSKSSQGLFQKCFTNIQLCSHWGCLWSFVKCSILFILCSLFASNPSPWCVDTLKPDFDSCQLTWKHNSNDHLRIQQTLLLNLLPEMDPRWPVNVPHRPHDDDVWQLCTFGSVILSRHVRICQAVVQLTWALQETTCLPVLSSGN